jgi:DNA-binding winged helix-turn-helix (wHTH) protein
MELPDGLTRIRIGAWQVELDSGRMSCGQRLERLQPRVLHVLKFLVQRQGKVASKQQLLQEVWNGVAVTENALAQAISALRAVFSSDPTVIIETIPTLGYRLIGCVRPAPEIGPYTEIGLPKNCAKDQIGVYTGRTMAEPSPTADRLAAESTRELTIGGLIVRLPVWKIAGWIFLAAVLVRMLIFGHTSHAH